MFPTTIAGSLPKPSWLAEPDKLWPQWRLSGGDLETGKLDATLLAVKLQEDAGIDIVTDGEQARPAFRSRLPGIRRRHRLCQQGRNGHPQRSLQSDGADRHRPAQAQGAVHGREARHARAHTTKKLKITMPGPMTIIDTIADGTTATA